MSIAKAAVLIGLAAVVGCSPRGTEVDRIRDSTGRLHAVIVGSDGHATSAESIAVYVAAANQKIEGRPVLVADHVTDPRFYWDDHNVLNLEFQGARIYRSQAQATVRGFGHPVSVKVSVAEQERIE